MAQESEKTVLLSKLVQANRTLGVDDMMVGQLSVGVFSISHVLQYTTKNRKIYEYKPPRNLLNVQNFQVSLEPVQKKQKQAHLN